MKRTRSLAGRSVLVAVLSALFVAAVAPLGVAAAGGIKFGNPEGDGLMIGSECLAGRAATNATVDINWKSSTGKLKANVTTVATGGRWSYCSTSKHLAVGDVLKATVGATSRTFTVPNLTVNVDRAADKFAGKAPASSHLLLTYPAGLVADFEETAHPTSDAQGSWSYVPGDDVAGGIQATVEYTSANDDHVIATGVAPAIQVEIDSSLLVAIGNPGLKFKVQLRDGGTNALLATAKTKVTDFIAIGDFENTSSEDVDVSVGNRVVDTAVAADLDWIVPDIQASANVSNDHVQGSCPPAGGSSLLASVSIMRNGDDKASGIVTFNEGSDGSFAINFGGHANPFLHPGNIKHGDTLQLVCVISTGDAVVREIAIP